MGRLSTLVERLSAAGDGTADDSLWRELDDLHATLVDALQALALLEPHDPSYPWDLGLYRSVVGRHREAAAAQLDVARSARFHAAKSFVLGDLPASAAALLPRLSLEDRPEIAALLAAAGRG